MRAAIGPNYVFAPSSDPHFLPLSFQKQLSPLIPFPCHPLKVPFQRIASVCLARNSTMTLNLGHRYISVERCHSVCALFGHSLPQSGLVRVISFPVRLLLPL